MTGRPTLKEVEAAARILHEAGLRHHWWDLYSEVLRRTRFHRSHRQERIWCNRRIYVDRGQLGSLMIRTPTIRPTGWPAAPFASKPKRPPAGELPEAVEYIAWPAP